MSKTVTIQDVNSAIMFNGFSNDQLNSIVMAVKYARNQLVRETKSNLRPGLNVSFVSSRTGRAVNGTVDKINRKFVIVNTTAGKWRVPANMLEVV
jgi:hypothetical protein